MVVKRLNSKLKFIHVVMRNHSLMKQGLLGPSLMADGIVQPGCRPQGPETRERRHAARIPLRFIRATHVWRNR